jgi:hypothetical protein
MATTRSPISPKLSTGFSTGLSTGVSTVTFQSGQPSLGHQLTPRQGVEQKGGKLSSSRRLREEVAAPFGVLPIVAESRSPQQVRAHEPDQTSMPSPHPRRKSRDNPGGGSSQGTVTATGRMGDWESRRPLREKWLAGEGHCNDIRRGEARR